MTNRPVVLTIAGSDSGGGAGIQADLKTFTALGVFGTSAVTCITAQNPGEVRGVEAISPEMVALQIRTVSDGFRLSAAKTGMLYSASIIKAVSKAVADCGLPTLVVDPVMVATSGGRLLREDAVDALCADLLPRAAVVTPNLPEAEWLCGHAIGTLAELSAAAREIGTRFGLACVAKGGHLFGGDEGSDAASGAGDRQGRQVHDVLFAEGVLTVFSSPRIEAAEGETHGTGCTFSAALTAWLSLGLSLRDAVKKAKEYVAAALRHRIHTGTHQPLGWLEAARSLSDDGERSLSR